MQNIWTSEYVGQRRVMEISTGPWVRAEDQVFGRYLVTTERAILEGKYFYYPF